jgi:hypothetical protein
MFVREIIWKYLLYLILIAICLGCREQNTIYEDPNSLLLKIANRNISYKELVTAVERLGYATEPTKFWKSLERLGSATEPPKFWSDIANSTEYTELHRRVAVAELFKRHIRPGMKLSELAEVLDSPTWMENSNVSTVESIYGYVPLMGLSPGTVFAVHLFPRLPGLGWFIYLRISGEIRRDDFLKVLRGHDVEQKVRDAEILEFGLTTPDIRTSVWQSGVVDYP